MALKLPPGKHWEWKGSSGVRELAPFNPHAGTYEIDGHVLKSRLTPEELVIAEKLRELGLPSLDWKPTAHEGEVYHYAPYFDGTRLDLTEPDVLAKLPLTLAADTVAAEHNLRVADRHGGNYLVSHDGSKVLSIDHDPRFTGRRAAPHGALYVAMKMIHGPRWLKMHAAPHILRGVSMGELK